MTKQTPKGRELAELPGQLSLPFWPEHLRGVPTAALYSALFAPIRRGARKAVERERIAAVGGFEIIYTGFRLDQSDLDIFEQCIHLARGERLGEPVRVRTRELLTQVGRSTGKSDREWLLRSLSRLQACAVEIQKGAMSYSGSLIQEQGRDDDAGMHYIKLNPRLVALFDQGYSQIVWQQRMQLAGKPLAQWLHGFIAGIQRPLTFKTVDLMRYAQSNYARVRDFRAALEEAADAIRAAGFPLVMTWSADNKTATFARSDAKPGATVIPPRGDSSRAPPRNRGDSGRAVDKRGIAVAGATGVFYAAARPIKHLHADRGDSGRAFPPILIHRRQGDSGRGALGAGKRRGTAVARRGDSGRGVGG